MIAIQSAATPVVHCRQRLAEYKLPRPIVFAATLPIDTTGNRRKAWLPE
jgi:hypothetical protein